MKGDEIVRPFDRHSNETATVRKHVTKYKHMRKWMLVFLGKLENRFIKIARVNSIRITKSIKLLSFCMVLEARCDVDIYKITERASPLTVKVYVLYFHTVLSPQF